MALWFESSVRYDKTLENGSVKRVTEKYLLDALSFTEAEARTIENIKPYMSGEYTIPALKKTKIAEVFFGHGDRYYLFKVAFVTIDEKTAQEKKSVTLMLIKAYDIEGAKVNFLDAMKGTVADFEVVSIAETPYLDVWKADYSLNVSVETAASTTVEPIVVYGNNNKG